MEDPAAAAAALRAWATAGGAPHAPVLRAPRAPRRPSVAAVGPDAPPGLPPDSVGPYLLNAEFTNTQPVAFRWQTGTYMLGSVLGRRTFRAVYEWVLRWLFEADPARLRACVGTAEFVSRLHRPDLATNPALLHSPILVASDLHAEGNLAPHELAHRMRQLLRHYELPPDTLTIWVRPS